MIIVSTVVLKTTVVSAPRSEKEVTTYAERVLSSREEGDRELEELKRERREKLVGSIYDATNQEMQQRLAEARKNGSGTYTSPRCLLSAHNCQRGYFSRTTGRIQNNG